MTDRRQQRNGLRNNFALGATGIGTLVAVIVAWITLDLPRFAWNSEVKAVTEENDIGQKIGSCSICRRCGAWRGTLGLEPTQELSV